MAIVLMKELYIDIHPGECWPYVGPLVYKKHLFKNKSTYFPIWLCASELGVCERSDKNHHLDIYTFDVNNTYCLF